MSENDYPKRVQKSVINRLDINKSDTRLTDDGGDREKIW